MSNMPGKGLSAGAPAFTPGGAKPSPPLPAANNVAPHSGHHAHSTPYMDHQHQQAYPTHQGPHRGGGGGWQDRGPGGYGGGGGGGGYDGPQSQYQQHHHHHHSQHPHHHHRGGTGPFNSNRANPHHHHHGMHGGPANFQRPHPHHSHQQRPDHMAPMTYHGGPTTPPLAPLPPALKPVCLVFCPCPKSRALVAANVASRLGFAHVPPSAPMIDGDKAAPVTHNLRELKKNVERLLEKSPAYNGFVVEISLLYHAIEIEYVVDVLRVLQLKPTHAAYVEVSLDKIDISEYVTSDYSQHSLAFEACRITYDVGDQVHQIDGADDANSIEDLATKLQTPVTAPLNKKGLSTAIFKCLPLLPDSKLLLEIANKLIEHFGSHEIISCPINSLDYNNLARTGRYLGRYLATLDVDGIPCLLVKWSPTTTASSTPAAPNADGTPATNAVPRFILLLPQLCAMAEISADLVPATLRDLEKLVPAGSKPQEATGVVSPTAPGEDSGAGAGESAAAAAPTGPDFGWVLASTVQVGGGGESGEEMRCTVFVNDVFFTAKDPKIHRRRWKVRFELLEKGVPEKPEGAIVVRQRFVHASGIKQLYIRAKDQNARINGLWFVNPGQAALSSLSDHDYRYPTCQNGFDARLWGGKLEDDGNWTFVYQQLDNEGTEVKGNATVSIPGTVVDELGINDGQIVRLELVKTEVAAPSKAGGKNKASHNKQGPATTALKANFLERREWLFVPTSVVFTEEIWPMDEALDAISFLPAPGAPSAPTAATAATAGGGSAPNGGISKVPLSPVAPTPTGAGASDGHHQQPQQQHHQAHHQQHHHHHQHPTPTVPVQSVPYRARGKK